MIMTFLPDASGGRGSDRMTDPVIWRRRRVAATPPVFRTIG
jgi:hypothetical protein